MDSEFKKNFAAGKKVRINSRAQKNLKKNCRKHSKTIAELAKNS